MKTLHEALRKLEEMSLELEIKRRRLRVSREHYHQLLASCSTLRMRRAIVAAWLPRLRSVEMETASAVLLGRRLLIDALRAARDAGILSFQSAVSPRESTTRRAAGFHEGSPQSLLLTDLETRGQELLQQVRDLERMLGYGSNCSSPTDRSDRAWRTYSEG
ncbi:MAG: hypothetical protein M3281_10025 [Chloroflexota bacterium]|nr:hypothetical protein [Chloroflexota bacterium]